MTSSPSATLRGSCLCRRISFTARSLPWFVSYCHCTTCRKLSGNPFLTFGMFRNEHVTFSLRAHSSTGESSDDGDGERESVGEVEPAITGKDVEMSEYSDIAVRGFCSGCKMPLFMKYHKAPNDMHVCLGLVDSATSTDAEGHDAKEEIEGMMRKVPKEHIFLDEGGWGKGLLGGREGVDMHGRMGEEFEKSVRVWRDEGGERRGDVAEGCPVW
ncbi:hypothetical protein LTS18_014856 [Coniosporium uncinatum]|uniref:Uncharacterized protein n=1 Tax=Coniosporium uncinatum TaxID=93489 RepID=A0ACC3DVM2_9PEZI|nr:hypothetical protein LTS18_014856 [Coniosporium uncinatum]